MSERSRGERRNGRALIGAVLATAAALLLLFLVGRSAGVAMGKLPAPGEALQMRLLSALSTNPNYKIGPDAMRTVRTAAVAAPLSYEPYFTAARAAEQAGRIPQAIRLMEEARARRPSHAATRVSLMGLYAMTARYQGAISEADVAMRLNSEAQKAILPILAQMLPYPAARDAIGDILARDPSWRQAFIDTAKDKVSPADAAGLLARVRKLRGADWSEPEGSLLVTALMRANRFGEAHSAWLSLIPPGARKGAGLLFDGDFTGARAPAPFNWTYTSTESGRAEASPARGGEPAHLAASYFGGAPIRMAEQSLVLPAGRYRLTVRARADRTQPSGEVFWTIACLPAKTEIGRLAFPRFTGQYAPYAIDFAVPAGCAAQTIALASEPGDLSQPVSMDFIQLRIRKIG
jgi:hypothetical protein